MDKGGLGATYHDGEIIVRQGDVGDRMFVIQKGRAQILVEKDGQERKDAIPILRSRRRLLSESCFTCHSARPRASSLRS